MPPDAPTTNSSAQGKGNWPSASTPDDRTARAVGTAGGITDLPYRRLVARFARGSWCPRGGGITGSRAGPARARARAELGFGEQATSVQLAGRDPYWMAEAARLMEANGARIIDINMGCPSKRVTTGLCGSALLRDLDLALS